eukprot:CCRYP_010926-RA/>CCRYP_010926-RA protein AED:0.42 eAED:0.42 QI:0/0/0/1/0/0/2/0/142
MQISDFPEDVIAEYNLRDKVDEKGMVYIEICHGCYGLPQAGLLAQESPEKRLNKHGYTQSLRTPSLWTHKYHPIQFSLMVDDFGVKHVGDDNLQHLIDVLRKDVHLDWYYVNHEVHLSIPGYVAKALKCFKHQSPTKPQNQL